jgi:hypothetical protein
MLRRVEILMMQKKVLDFMQPRTRYRLTDIVRALEMTRVEARSAVEFLVSWNYVARDSSCGPDGDAEYYLSNGKRTAAEADRAKAHGKKKRIMVSSFDVLLVMKPRVAYRTAELADKLGVEVKRLNNWMPRLTRERAVEEAGSKARPRRYCLFGTKPESGEPQRWDSGSSKITRISNDGGRVPSAPTFEQEYGLQLKRLARLSQSVRQQEARVPACEHVSE